jgi:hypothetical protein
MSRHVRRPRWLVFALRPWQRHSSVLAVAGLAYIGFGIAYLKVALTDARVAGLRWMLGMAPLDFWAACFVAVGVLALISTRWPPASKTWGYTGLSGLAFLWGSGYLVGVLFLGAPGQSITSALVWLLIGAMWWAITGLVNPDDIPRIPRPREDQRPEAHDPKGR